MSQIPEPWASALVVAGFTDPRYGDDRPSLGALAEKAGLHTTTVSRMVRGIGTPKQANVNAVAEALRRDVVEVSRWARQARTESEPYQAPPEADLLTRREREALNEFIRAVAETRKAGGGHADRSAPMNEAGPAPANNVTNLTRPDHGDPPPAPLDQAAARNLGTPSRGQQLRDQQDDEAEDRWWEAGTIAAREGVPEHLPDDTTGEESQMPPEDNE